MTAVLVSDTSIIIDLERGNLLAEAFGLSCTFVVPDLLYRRELHDEIGPQLIELGLVVAELDGDEVAQAQGYRDRTNKISLPDAFALSLAKSHGYVLLTGDQALRALAESEGVVCHGVLWLLDEMKGANTVTVGGCITDSLQWRRTRAVGCRRAR